MEAREGWQKRIRIVSNDDDDDYARFVQTDLKKNHCESTLAFIFPSLSFTTHLPASKPASISDRMRFLPLRTGYPYSI